MAHDRIDGELITDASIDEGKLSFAPGDMSKAVYDSDDDGKVDAAEVADTAPWNGISGKPTAFGSDESVVAVDNDRFANFTPGAGGRLEQTLDGIDTVLGSLAGLASITMSVPNNDIGYAVLGDTSSVGAAILFYSIRRGGDYRVGMLYLLSNGTNVEIGKMPDFAPTFSVGDTGVAFGGRVNAGNVELSVDTDNSGDSAEVTIKWISFAELS